ncbi:MAG: hypothetical protein Q9227_002517 [Pyrenula ochraceoflavens]
MAENVPPNSSSGPKSANDSAARGLPYYEKLRKELRESLAKKKLLDKNLANIEESIYNLESKYLEETGGAGNIIKGFDNYIKGATVSTAGANASSGTISGSALGGAGRKKTVVMDQDRVFSRSSALYMRSESPTTSSPTTTPSHAQTPTGSFGAGANGTNNKGSTAGANKKNKKSIVESEDDAAKPTKRQKTSVSRD